MAQIGVKHAPGAQGAGVAREQDPPHGQVGGRLAGVQAAGAAESGEGEIAGVQTFFEKAEADGAGHMSGGDRQDAAGRRLGGELGRFRHARLNRSASGVGVQRHGATKKTRRRDPPQGDIGVGHRRPVAALAIGRRAGGGAGAFGADIEGANRVNPGQRAAAGADSAHFDHRQAHRTAADLALGDHPGAPFLDQRDVIAGPAHVDGDQIVEIEMTGQGFGGEGAAAWPRQQQTGRLARRHRRSRDTAVGLHQVNRSVKPGGRQTRFQTAEIGADHRHQQGIENGRRTALELAKLGADIARQRQVHVRQAVGDTRGDGLLVIGGDMGVQATNGGGFDLKLGQAINRRVEAGGVQGRRYPTVGGDPLDHAQAARAGYQKQAVFGQASVDVAAHVAADFQHILETGGGDKGAGRQLLFQHRVGGDGGAVDQHADLVEAEAEPFRRFGNAGQQAD